MVNVVLYFIPGVSLISPKEKKLPASHQSWVWINHGKFILPKLVRSRHDREPGFCKTSRSSWIWVGQKHKQHSLLCRVHPKAHTFFSAVCTAFFLPLLLALASTRNSRCICKHSEKLKLAKTIEGLESVHLLVRAQPTATTKLTAPMRRSHTYIAKACRLNSSASQRPAGALRWRGYRDCTSGGWASSSHW